MATEKRLIDANALCDLLDVEYKRKMKLVRKGETHLDTLGEGLVSMSVLLGTMPTVDAVEVVHGRWELHGDDDSLGGSYFCSECGYCMCEEEYLDEFSSLRYCPHCGAKMDGGSDEIN